MDGQFDYPANRFPLVPDDAPVRTLTYFGEEVPTIVHAQNLAQSDMVLKELGEQFPWITEN